MEGGLRYIEAAKKSASFRQGLIQLAAKCILPPRQSNCGVSGVMPLREGFPNSNSKQSFDEGSP